MMGALFVVTANRTDDGAVLYLRADRSWTSDLGQAQVVGDTAERDALIAWAADTQQRDVCDPYAFEVRATAEGVDPLTARERIRAAGPAPVLRQWGY
jgi:hypothetical protein